MLAQFFQPSRRLSGRARCSTASLGRADRKRAVDRLQFGASEQVGRVPDRRAPRPGRRQRSSRAVLRRLHAALSHLPLSPCQNTRSGRQDAICASRQQGSRGDRRRLATLAARSRRVRMACWPILLAIVLCACGLFATRAQAAQVISYPSFSGPQRLQLNSAASIVGSSLQLTPAQLQQSGTAFSRTEIQPSGSFGTEFELRMHESNTLESFGDPADGIAFVLQPLSAAQVGLPGGDLGYAGVTPSAVVQFDIYQNSYDRRFPTSRSWRTATPKNTSPRAPRR